VKQRVLVDSHAHLQWASFNSDREKVLERAKEANVVRIVNIGFDLDGSIKAVELAQKYDQLYATVGFHPHSATQLNQITILTLRELSCKPKVVAIGEIGLDYFRNFSPKEIQKKAFESQLALAAELNLPVVIHDRDAHQDVLGILRKFEGKVRGVMHCFSGNKEFAQQCIELGFMISFAGNLTYPKATLLHEAAKWADLKNLLIETDCPFLTPQEMRGKRNEPSYLPSVARKIAELKGISMETVADATARNAKVLFSFK
jgi:TatD DNase family protein